jgi:hypothetical protein
MTEFIRIQVTDLADLIHSMDDWHRAHDRVVEEAQKADVAWNRDIADVRMELSSFRRMVQEALGFDQPALLSPDELDRRIRDLRSVRHTRNTLRQAWGEPVDLTISADARADIRRIVSTPPWDVGQVVLYRGDGNEFTTRLRHRYEDGSWRGEVTAVMHGDLARVGAVIELGEQDTRYTPVDDQADAIESRAWELGDVIAHTREDGGVLAVRLNTRRPAEDPSAGGKYWHGKIIDGPLNDPMIGEDIGLLEGHPANRHVAVSADELSGALDRAQKRMDLTGLGHQPLTFTIPAGLLFERLDGTAHAGELHVVGPVRDVDGDDGPPTQSMPPVARRFFPGDPCPDDTVQVVGWLGDGEQVWARDRRVLGENPGYVDTWSFHDGQTWIRESVPWDELLAESGGVVDCTAENELDAVTINIPAEGP